MVRIYGISNCDTMQKAIKWLKANEIQYEFHNYKESGIDKATITQWLRFLPLNKLVNTKSATYRGLTEEEKSATTTKAKAVTLMLKHNSLIKRPVWDFGKDEYFLGWDEKAVGELIEAQET